MPPAAEVAPTASTTPPAPGTPAPRSLFHILVPATIALLGLLTALVAFVPGFQLVSVFPEADWVVNSATTLAAGSISVLAWIRYSQTGEADSLFQAAAFLTLFAGGAILLVLLLSGMDQVVGFDRRDPGQAPIYLWTLQRSVAAGLLFIGGVTALRRVSVPNVPLARAIATVPGLLVAAASATIIALATQLPTVIADAQLAMIIAPTNRFEPSLLSTALVTSQLVVAALFLLAAFFYTRLYTRDAGERPYVGYLAAGLAVAAFAQMHFAVTPGAYADLLTSGDVLRVGFYALILAGVAAAARGDLVQLRRANETLIELRKSDAQRITLEERARLAREVHDGLVQDLWLARLTHGRLTQMPNLETETREVAERVDSLLENALAEARQAIVAMQPTPDPSFGNLLMRFTEDYGDRFGLEVECTVRGESVQLTGRVQAEVLRICREALNNARKHADATLVRVELVTQDETLTLRVTDNGRGFNPEHVSRSGFGLQGMRDRADAIGATLEVESAPMSGTQVVLTLRSGETDDEHRQLG